MDKAWNQHFGVFRSFFWPIYKHEHKKFIPLFLMLCFLCFNYTILRCVKDALVITASGAEVIPFIKIGGMLPMAIIATYLYTKLSHRFTQEKIIYLAISTFLIFFATFTFFLYPNQELLHPTVSANWLEAHLPQGFKGLISAYKYWTYTLFYVFAELWNTILYTVIFWSFINETSRMEEAKRFYGVFSVGTNLATVAAGFVGNYIERLLPYAPISLHFQDPWAQTLRFVVLIVITFGILTMLLFRQYSKNYLQSSRITQEKILYHPRKKKFSMRESFSHISNSTYLFYIAIIVISYNLTAVLVEMLWKEYLRILCPTPSHYFQYLNNLNIMIGVFSCILSFLVANIIHKFGWTITAMITPSIVAITSFAFFLILFIHDHVFQASDIQVLQYFTLTSLAVFIGAVQNCFSKAAKYSVFDATKEMAFIPLDKESLFKGKAIIDGVGARFGKSAASSIYVGLFLSYGSLLATFPYIVCIFTLAISFWFYSVNHLGRQLHDLLAKKEKQKMPIPDEEKVPVYEEEEQTLPV